MAEAGDKKISARVVGAIALAAGLTPLNSTMLSVALRPIGATFHSSDAMLTRLLVTSYLVTSIVMQAPGGRIGDQLGHRRTLRLGQLVFGAGTLLAMLTPWLWGLAAARILMAVAGALIVPSATALLRTELPPHLRGRAFGAFGATMALAAAMGPVLGGQVTVLFGWRAVFAINLVLLPLSALLAGFDAKDAPIARASGPRPARPFVDLALLRLPVFVAGGMVIALQNLAMYGLLFELPSVCALVLGAPANRSGPLLVAMMIPMVLLSPVAGRLTDAFGARSVALAGTITAALGVATLLAVPLRSMVAPIPGLAIFGVGLALSSAPSQSAAMSAAPADRSGVAAGMMAILRYLGGVAGTLLISAILVTTAGVEVVRAGHQTTLMLFLVALLGALGFAFLLPGKRVVSSATPAT